MDFGEILTKAWKTIWKFKVLWIFGFLSSCGRGMYSGGRGSGTSYRFSVGDSNLPDGMEQFFNDIEIFFDDIQGWEIAALIFGFFLFILIMILITNAINAIGRIGLVNGTLKAEDGAEKLTFRGLFSTGRPFFWRVFGINILIGLAVALGVIVFFLPFIGISFVTPWIGLLCLIPLICLLVPLSWLVNLLIEQINLAIIVEDLKIRQGVIRGWEVFKNNLGDILVMGVILGILSFIVGLLLAIPMLMVMVPALLGVIGGGFSDSRFLLGGGIAAAFLGFFIMLPIAIVVNSILQAYLKSAWTLTFSRLTKAPDGGYETVILSREEVA